MRTTDLPAATPPHGGDLRRRGRAGRAPRSPALLAFAGPPTPAQLDAMVSCGENLERDLHSLTIGTTPGAVFTGSRKLSRLAAAVRDTGAAVVVVATGTPAATVRRLAAATRRPVVIARSGQRWRLVLAATDLRTRGTPVVSAAAAVAATCGARALVLHNVAPAWTSQVPVSAPAGGPASRRLRRLARIAARTTPPSTVVVAGAGAAERAIVEAADQRSVDLVVLGMRRPGRHRNARCADRVIAAATTNVMVVPVGASRDPVDQETQP